MLVKSPWLSKSAASLQHFHLETHWVPRICQSFQELVWFCICWRCVEPDDHLTNDLCIVLEIDSHTLIGCHQLICHLKYVNVINLRRQDFVSFLQLRDGLHQNCGSCHVSDTEGPIFQISVKRFSLNFLGYSGQIRLNTSCNFELGLLECVPDLGLYPVIDLKSMHVEEESFVMGATSG